VCHILDHDEDNVSHHLPICLETSVVTSSVPKNDTQPICHSVSSMFVPAKWDNYEKVLMYNHIVQDKLAHIDCLANNISDCEIQETLDRQLNKINQAMHSAATEAGCTPKCKHFPKPYWNPYLSRMRDRKRFWWRLWVENGRPRSGAIYDTYKLYYYKWLKRQLRRLSRQCVNNQQRHRLGKLDNYLNTRKMSSFWNAIKRLRRTKVSSDLQPNDFQTFYENVMTDSGNRTLEQNSDKARVLAYAAECKGNIPRQHVSSLKISDLIDKLPGEKPPGIDGVTSEHLKNGKSSKLCELLANLFHCQEVLFLVFFVLELSFQYLRSQA
jgi:hypothetical protein